MFFSTWHAKKIYDFPYDTRSDKGYKGYHIVGHVVADVRSLQIIFL